MSIYDDMEDFFPEQGTPAPQPQRNLEASRQYAAAQSAEIAPEGTVWLPEMGTYVDADVAAQLGVEGAQVAPARAPEAYTQEDNGEPYDGEYDDLDPEDFEASDEADGDGDDDEEYEGTNSETLDDLQQRVSFEQEEAIVENIVSGDFDSVLGDMAGSLGVDPMSASTLIETSVEEARPAITDEIGGDAFASIFYAATRTDDPMAREILTGMVRGDVPKGRMSAAYNIWYDSLPDAY